MPEHAIISERLKRIILFCIILLTFQYVAFYYISIGVFPRAILYFFYFIIVFLSFILIWNIKIHIGIYQFFVLLAYSFMFINSLFNWGDDFGQSIADVLIYIPILTGLFFYKLDTDFLSQTFKIISICALVLMPYIMSIQKLDVDSAINRDYAWTETFFYTPLFWAVVPAVLLSTLKKKNLLLSIAYWIAAIILNLTFLKRFILVDSALLLVVILIINAFHSNGTRNIIRISFLIFLLVSGALYFKGDAIIALFDATSNRIETTSEDLSAFDRFIESENYLRDASVTDIIIGRGFTGSHRGLGKKAEALHVGWGNFILKGGIFLAVLILIPFLKLTRLSIHIKSSPVQVQFSYWLLIIYLIRLTYANMHNLSPEMLIFYYALYTVMNYNIKRNKNHKRTRYALGSSLEQQAR